jgi:serine/threonine-protein kinase
MGRDVAPDEALLGRTIASKYRIDEFVGGGAMGAVYKARQIALDKVVAVKVLHREIQKDAQFTLRFKREAKAASRLDHPNSMRVLDFGEESDGLLYMVMEYLDGIDLFELHRKNFPLAPDRIAGILSQALAALAVAHDQGIVHRDLKPENIMVLAGKDDEGNAVDVVKVCDFGIAKIVDAGRAKITDSSAARLSTRGLVVGTPEYMSPEQGRGEALDPRADLYSMGIILYQLITGTVPFDAESAIGIVLKHVTEEAKPPHEIRPDVDPRLEAVALKAMQKKKDDRYQSAREMRAALRPMLDAATLHSHPDLSVPSGPARLSPMESAATVPTIPIGTREESKPTISAAELSDEPIDIPRKRVSVPLVAAVMLTIGAVGTIAAISFKKSNEAVAGSATASVTATATATASVTATATASVTATASTAVSASATAKPKPTVATTTGPKPSAEPIDPDTAHVAIVSVHAEGMSESAVRSAIDVARATSCYQDGLRGPNAKGRAFQQTLHIETDGTSGVKMAAMPAPDFLGNLQMCFVQKLINSKIAGATDGAKADVVLQFSPR